MTRDELIAGTRQLVDEGVRLQADPSLGSLQVWLQHSDDLLATAWGSMDRYHLAWLMVGKPKGIVRGRPMTPDEEAAYVREVAEQKTAALRMSLDAVERQGMPFVGETGGVGAPARAPRDRPPPGPRRPARRTGRPIVPGCRPTRSSPSGWPRPAAGRRAISTTTRRARRDRTGCSDDARPCRRSGACARSRPADPVARDYILLALRLEQHIPGLVDGYFGPADLKAQVDMEQLRSPARLRDDAAELRSRLGSIVPEPDRRAWLDVQLVALETQAAALAGDALPYLEHVERCFAFAPRRRPDAEFDAAAARLDELLPGDGPLDERLAAWDEQLEIPIERLPAVVDWLVERFRATAAVTFGLPDGEDLRVSLVTGQPWGAYNWFDGGRRSRIDVNTDLPVRASSLPSTIAHEAYPGHHLEHAWKEADLVDRQGRLESSILLINTPECLISEGLANLGARFAVAPEDRADLFVELFERAGLAVAADPAALAPGRRADGRDGRAPPRPDRDRRQRGHPPPRGRRLARRRPGLPPRRRPLSRGAGRQAPRVHRASAVADVRLRLRRGRGAPRALGRRRPRGGSGRPFRAPAPRAAHAGGGQSSRLNATRSSPSAS